MNSQVWWYVSRSSGIIAWLLREFLGLLGAVHQHEGRCQDHHAGAAARPAPVPGRRARCVFTGVHLVGLVADSYVHFGWKEIFVPMAVELEDRCSRLGHRRPSICCSPSR